MERIRAFIALAQKTIAPTISGERRAAHVDSLVAQATPLLEVLQAVTLVYQDETRSLEERARRRQVKLAEIIRAMDQLVQSLTGTARD